MYSGDIKKLSLEELQKVYLEDTEELNNNINTLNTGIEKYKENEKTFNEEINKLKLVNYDLFTKVGQKTENNNNINDNNVNNQQIEKASISDIIKDFNF